MRLSVIKGDPGYCQNGHNVKIFFNDVEQKGVVLTADEERGSILRYAKDAKGNFIIDKEDAVTEEVTGKVRIVVPEGWVRL